MKKLDNINFKYVPAAKTNILETLKRCGFEPPSESKWYRDWETDRKSTRLNSSHRL